MAKNAEAPDYARLQQVAAKLETLDRADKLTKPVWTDLLKQASDAAGDQQQLVEFVYLYSKWIE